MIRRLVLVLAALALVGLTSTAFAQAPPTTAAPAAPTTAPPATTSLAPATTVVEGGGPVLTVVPNTGLVEGQEANLVGENFQSSGNDIGVDLCALPVENIANNCEPIGLTSIVNGRINTFFNVERYIDRGATIDCAAVPCAVVVQDESGLGVAPISFAGVISANPGFTG